MKDDDAHPQTSARGGLIACCGGRPRSEAVLARPSDAPIRFFAVCGALLGPCPQTTVT